VSGASRLPNRAGLVYKVLGMETEPVKATVRAFWDLARLQVLGAPVPAARPWGPPLLPDAIAVAQSARAAGPSRCCCAWVVEPRWPGSDTSTCTCDWRATGTSRPMGHCS